MPEVLEAESSPQWYICKQASGNCSITSNTTDTSNLGLAQSVETWGPFSSQNEAIAKRVGLIRAGKCVPS